MRCIRATWLVSLALLAPPAVAEEVASLSQVERVHDTLEQMRERRAAADAERGETHEDFRADLDAKAAERAAAAERAQQRAAQRKRRRGFFAEFFGGIFQAGREIVGAANDLKDHVEDQVHRHTGPIGKVLKEVDRAKARIVDVGTRPLRRVFDRMGLPGEILETILVIEAGGALDARVSSTRLGEALDRLGRSQDRLDSVFAEWTERLDRVDGQLADLEALVDFLSGIKDPRVREALEDYIEGRLGVPLGDIVIGEGGRGTARDNVRTGVQGAHGRPGGMPPGIPGGMEGRGRPPMPPGGRAEGTGRGRMRMPPR